MGWWMLKSPTVSVGGPVEGRARLGGIVRSEGALGAHRLYRFRILKEVRGRPIVSSAWKKSSAIMSGLSKNFGRTTMVDETVDELYTATFGLEVAGGTKEQKPLKEGIRPRKTGGSCRHTTVYEKLNLTKELKRVRNTSKLPMLLC